MTRAASIFFATIAAGCGRGESTKPGESELAPVVESVTADHLIVGMVVGERGPLPGARVRIKGQPELALSDKQGRFQLERPSGDKINSQLTVTAWKDGHFIGGASLGDDSVTVRLKAHTRKDCRSYQWIDPTPDPLKEHNCGNCHGEIYREWKSSGHARSAVGRRFLNLYEGTDWHGRPGSSWSLLDEHPDGAGVCAACHTPSAVPVGVVDSDELNVEGVHSKGVHCDFCHKIADVSEEYLGLSHGAFGLSLLRPAEGQLFFGPLDDVDRGEDTFSPLQQESRLCASCHEGIVFGIPVYTTYSEWLASPAYGEGKQCQSCHMTPTGLMTNIAPDSGGIERDPRTLGSHSFLPGGLDAMLRRCLHVDVEAVRVTQKGGADQTGSNAPSLRVTVQVEARDVGHRVPTGFIDRHLILLVDALGDTESRTMLISGPQLPMAVGESLSGQPGRLFAKLLRSPQGESPVPFWRAGAVPTDTRLQPKTPVVTHFTFAGSIYKIRVRLIYRRFWKTVADDKGWPNNDILVVDKRVTLGDTPE